MRARTLASACCFALAVGACGGDDGGASPDAALGDPTLLTGYVTVELVDADPKYTTINARVNNGVTPPLKVLNAMTADGDCQLLIPSYPLCTTPCGSAGVCVADETCMPYPTSQDVGTIHVTGVHTAAGASELDLTHLVSSGTHTYSHGATALAYPGFAEGDPITAAIGGGAFTPAFTIATTGIAPLVVTSPEPTLDRNTPVTITWTPPSGSATSRIGVKVEISHHGGFKGQIECDTADDGSLTLGGPIVTQLLDLGVAGFPTITTTRTIVSAGLTTAGRVDFTVSSAISQAVHIPGLISCTDDTECTPPATCQDDLTCR